MTPPLDDHFAGVHDLQGGTAHAEVLRRAFSGAQVCQARSLALASGALDAEGQILIGLAGRVHDAVRLRLDLGMPADAPIRDVLAQGYARWGSRLLERIRGPFALVVWDTVGGHGLLAQDQLGGRSLFTLVDGSRVYFATEVELLLRLVPSRPGPDDIAVAYHLLDHSVPDGRTLYEGVGRVGAGRHLRLSDAGRTEGRHWEPRYVAPRRVSREELAAELRAELDRAVAEATPSEGTSALLLSGGLDSSAVAALAAPRAGDLRAVGAAFPAEPEIDETLWARRVAEHTGIPLRRVDIVDPRPLDAAAEFLRQWRLPLPAPGIVIEAPLIEAARGMGATVALDGQGGDELFGAAHFVIADRLRAGRPLSAWRLARRYPSIGSRPAPRHVWMVMTNVGIRGALAPSIHERIRAARPDRRYLPGWLKPHASRLIRETEDPWRWKRLDGPRWWASLADTLTRGRERADIADYVRRRARMGGLEARSPLLDLGLVELALRIPPETNFDPVISRSLVRESLNGDLPREVLGRRDKSNFSGFYHRLLAAPDNLGRIRSLLGERGAAMSEYVEIESFRREYLNRPPAVGSPGWRQWAGHVWNVVTAEMWLRAQGG